MRAHCRAGGIGGFTVKDFMLRVLRSNWYYALLAISVLACLAVAYGIFRVVATGRPWPFG